MSFLSSIKSLGSSLVNKVVAPVLDATTVALAHPIQTIKAAVGPTTLKQVEQQHFAQPLGTQIKQVALGTAGIAATVVGAGAVGTAAKAGTLVPAAVNTVKSLVPATTKGKIIAAAVLPVAASAVIEKPSLALSVPKDIINFQSDAGKLLANPSLSAAKELVVESPVISSLVAAGGVAAVGLGTASIVSNVLNTKAVQENTKATFSAQPVSSDTQPVQIINQLPASLSAPIPEVVAPAKAAPSGSTPKKKKKTTKKKKKTRRSKKKSAKKKKKTTKKKKKTIKRRKTKK